MSKYAYVENNTVVKVGSLPNSYQNITGFNHLNNSQLKQYGFYPYEYSTPEYDKLTQRLGDVEYEILSTKVKGARKVVDLTPQELEIRKNSYVTQAGEKLNSILFHSDWVFVNDSGLDSNQLEKYEQFRIDLSSVKSNLENYSLEELFNLIKKMNNCNGCMQLRLLDFSEPMNDLKDYLESLLNE